MLRSCLALSVCFLVVMHAPADASPGDVFVPAHRTKDGSYVPPNVAPLSGGTYLARRPTRGAAAHRAARREAVTSSNPTPAKR